MIRPPHRGSFGLYPLLSCLVLSVDCRADERLLDAAGRDWPMFGGNPSRNAVVPNARGPMWWQVKGGFDADENELEEDIGIRWSANLGHACTAQPIVSGNLLWVGTNNEIDDGKKRKDASVLVCFDARTGKELYRYVSDRHKRVYDWEYSPMACAPLIEGDLMWFTTKRWETICMDIGPLRRGEGNPRIVWKVDLIERFGIMPHGEVMGNVRTSSPASHKNWLYVVTNNGTDWSHAKVPAPDAPSLLCLNKHTGKLIWEDASPGKDIIHGQWATPLVAQVNGKTQIIVPQGDGWLRAFSPGGDGEGGSKILWEFNMNPKEAVWKNSGFKSRSNIIAAPVYYQGRIYLSTGGTPEHAHGWGRLCCIDPGKGGDVSSELAVDAHGKPLAHRRLQQVDAEKGEKVIPNRNSALVWEINGYEKGVKLYRSLSNVAIANDLVIALDYEGSIRCLDAKTGKTHWIYESNSRNLGSPLIVGDKVYVANEDGEVHIFGLSKDPKIAMAEREEKSAPLATIYMDNTISASPVFANQTLYLATASKLYAIPQGVEEEPDQPAARRPGPGKSSGPRSMFVPTPPEVVEKMLELADVKESDLVYDLGSGDGRIVIAAAKKYGCKAAGYELDQKLVEHSRKLVNEANLESKVTIERKDIFTVDLSRADVVAVFLLPTQLDALKPQFAKLKPGARIVAHHYAIPGVKPDQTITVKSEEDGAGRKVYLWTTPLSPKQEE